MSEYQLVQETMQRYTKTVKFSAGSLMVGGYLKRNGARKLIKIDGILNYEKYITLLRSHLLSDIAESEIFKPEKAPYQTLHETNKIFTDDDVADILMKQFLIF